MSRQFQFFAIVDVSSEFRKAEPEKSEELAREAVARKLDSDQRGPRGGRYRPIGNIEWRGWYIDFPTAQLRYVASRFGRYVRP